MSCLPHHIRITAATRRVLDIIERGNFAAEADAGFDGGEFSRPAHGRMVECEIAEVLAELRVRDAHVQAAIDEMTDPAPLGAWHGENR